MSRNLLVCCDGTWNDAGKMEEEKRSNVWRFLEAVAPVRGETNKYFPGVGTGDLKDRLKGGIWGFGIGRSICEAYGWLAKHYQPGDHIFLVGFSRGAFTVRSLAGMIGCRGLNGGLSLLKDDAFRKGVAAEYEAYRDNKRAAKPGPHVHFLGVFDTVGRLGVPDDKRVANWFDDPEKWAFHDTQLGTHVIHGRHAVAIDECLADFMPTLWVDDQGHPIYDLGKNGRSVKQLWFCGYHSDIGGGSNRLVTNIALKWMLVEAKACGLDVDANIIQNLSFNPAADLSKSSWSPLRKMPRGVPLLEPVNVGGIIHTSVMERRNKYPAYWPTRILETAPIQFDVSSFKKDSWQQAGIWLEKGVSCIASTAGRRGGKNIKGYVANGGNPKIDGTCPDHQKFDLHKPFKVEKGGYVYFRVLVPPFTRGGKGGGRRQWTKLTVSLERK